MCEESLDPLLLSEDVAISARDHSLGLGGGFGSWTAMQESTWSIDSGLNDSDTLTGPWGLT